MPTLWCGTDYVCDEKFWEDLVKDGKVLFAAFGNEVCPSTGREHLQFYCQTDRKAVGAMRKMLGGRHVEVMQGSLKANETYCSKESELKMFGLEPSNAGSRNNLAAKIIIDDGGTLDDIIMECFDNSVIRWAERYIGIKHKRRKFEQVKVTWIHGPTGCGKSRKAREMCGEHEPWVSNVDFQWFDGYDGQVYAIFDDFRDSSIKYDWLLRVLDGYNLRVAVKGSHTYFSPKNIIITSIKSPYECYKGVGECHNQLMRRISEIIDMSKSVCAQEGNTRLPVNDAERADEENFFE